jgi:hypothetical protein
MNILDGTMASAEHDLLTPVTHTNHAAVVN